MGIDANSTSPNVTTYRTRLYPALGISVQRLHARTAQFTREISFAPAVERPLSSTTKETSSMETRLEQQELLRAKYNRLSAAKKDAVRKAFPAACEGLLGNAAYFPSVGLITMLYRMEST